VREISRGMTLAETRCMKILMLALLLAGCGDDDGSIAADMSYVPHPKEGQLCGGDGGPVDPNACGAGYVCMIVGTLAPVCLVISNQGEPCGGNTSRPRQCAAGLYCKSNGIPDGGGTCQPIMR
jgi:hypothetical protein